MWLRIGLLIFFVTAFCMTKASAQHESTLYFMGALPQSSYTNPAVQPRYNFSLGLPGSSIMAYYANNSFAYNDMLDEKGDADASQLYSVLREKNYLTAAVQADLLRLSFRINPRLYLSFNNTFKHYNQAMVPKGLVAFGLKDIELFSTSASVQVQAESLTYLESGATVSYTVNNKLNVGIRASVLHGLANVTTVRALGTTRLIGDETMYVEADLDVRSSGIQQFDEDDDFDPWDNRSVFKRNKGFSFDVGASYKVADDRLVLSGSILNIGFINWRNNTYGFRLRPSIANHTLPRIDLQDLIDGNEIELEDSDLIDEKFTPEEGAIASYKTTLPMMFNVGASYALRRSLFANVLMFSENYKGRFAPGASVSMVKEFGTRASLSVSYTATQNLYNNVGMGFSFKVSAFQFYLVGDNLLRSSVELARDRDPEALAKSIRYTNFRTGFNIVSGWRKSQEKLRDRQPLYHRF